MFRRDAQGVYRVPAFERLSWLDHGFGSRVSAVWIPSPYAWVKQIHSTLVLEAGAATGCLGEADGLTTATPGNYVSIRTADCIPVLIADERHRAVAAIHAGWKGTAGAIVMEAVARMGERYGSKPEDLIAAIGPGICGDCYEVGAEVAQAFQRWFPERNDLDRKTAINLPEANRRQLEAAGLAPNRVFTGAPCTVTEPDDFYSWRSRREDGRMVTAIRVRQFADASPPSPVYCD